MSEDTPDSVNYDRAVMALEDRVWSNDESKARETALDELDAVSKESLRALVKEFREKLERMDENAVSHDRDYDYIHGASYFLEDLEEIIE